MILTLFCSVIIYACRPNGRLYQCFLITTRLRNLDILKIHQYRHLIFFSLKSYTMVENFKLFQKDYNILCMLNYLLQNNLQRISLY